MDEQEEHLVVKCQNRTSHVSPWGNLLEGNIIAFIGKKSITVRCPDKTCRCWTRLDLSFPGLDGFDLRKAGIVQTAIEPHTMKLNTIRAPCVIDA